MLAEFIYAHWLDRAAATAPVVKRSSLLALKDLMFVHNRRRRKSRDEEPIGLLFGRDLDQICRHGKLSPSLAVSRP